MTTLVYFDLSHQMAPTDDTIPSNVDHGWLLAGSLKSCRENIGTEIAGQILGFQTIWACFQCLITARLWAAVIMIVIMIMISSVSGQKGHLHGRMRGGSYFWEMHTLKWSGGFLEIITTKCECFPINWCIVHTYPTNVAITTVEGTNKGLWKSGQKTTVVN